MFLFFAFVALVFLLIFVVARGTRNYRTTLKANMPKSMKYGATGAIVGVIIAGMLSFIAGEAGPFIFVFLLGPILLFVGLTTGIILGLVRRRQEAGSGQGKSSARGYIYAILTILVAAWAVFLYVRYFD